MSNSKKKRKNLKRKLDTGPYTNDEFKNEDRELFVKKSKGHKTGKKKLKMSSGITSSSCSTASSRDMCQKDSNKDKEDGVKTQCDLCRLSYASQAKLDEHLVSLMHHTKLEEAEKNIQHDCFICKKSFDDMASYREHIGTSSHLEKLETLRSNRKGNNKGRMENNRWNKKPPHFPSNFKDNNAGWRENSQWPDLQHNAGFSQRFDENFQNLFWSNMMFENKNGNSRSLDNREEYFNNKFSSKWKNSQRYNPQNEWYQYGSNDVGYDPQDQGERYQNYNKRRQSNREQHGDGSRDGREDQNGSIPWGSRGFWNGPEHVQRLQGKYNYNNRYNNEQEHFTEDTFDNCWDEQSFREHEDFLAGMDQGCSQGSSKQIVQRRHYDPHDSYKKGKWGGSSFKDRKRPRQEDYPFDSSPKSSKPLSQKDSSSNTGVHSKSHSWEDATNSSPKAPVSGNGNSNTKEVELNRGERVSYSDKALDNASDTILERAERLCKELREKRETSNAQRASLLKSHSQDSINDKMNNLTKTQQSYMKGHIKGGVKDLRAVKTSASHKSLSPSSPLPDGNVSSCSSSGKIKTLEEIRMSIEQSVMEDVQSSAAISNAKSIGRTRTSSLGESTQRLETQNVRGRTPSVDNDDRQGRQHSKMDATVSSSKSGPRAGSKQAITKEDLHKMVNCPRARTERVHLARMIQSRGDSKSSAPMSSRVNINLEGLYDASDVPDLQLDIGDNMATIKLEELSDEIRTQILGLIQNDIGAGQDKKTRDEVEILGSDGDQVKISEKTTVHKKGKSRSLLERSKTKAHVKGAAMNHSELPQESNVSAHPKKARPAESNVIPVGGSVKALNTPERFSSTSESSDKNVHGNVMNCPSQSPHKKTDKSSGLTAENVFAKFPTIMNTLGNKAEKIVSEVIDKSLKNPLSIGDSNVPSSDLSLSRPTLSSPLPSEQPSAPPHFGDAAMNNMNSPLPSTNSPFEMINQLGLLDNQLDLSTRIDLPKDPKDRLRSVAPYLANGETSTTVSELLTLSEQEECVKQEMTNMELRLTRLHRLLEQAVNQITKCTERRSQLQEEEKTLSNKRISLLREAAASSQQDSQFSDKSTISRPSSMITSQTVNSQAQNYLSLSADVNIAQLTATTSNYPSDKSLLHRSTPGQQDYIVDEDTSSPVPESSSLSRSEWLAKFSAYLPKELISSKETSRQSSQEKTFPHQETSRSTSSTTQCLPPPSSLPSSADTSNLQLLAERDSQSFAHKNLSTTYLKNSLTNSDNRNHGLTSSEVTTCTPAARNISDKSPIMYLGTIKNASGQGNKGSSPGPVMMISNETISSLFKDISERNMNTNPAVSVSGIEHPQAHSGNSIPPVVCSNSITSPRQEDSDIGSIASVASGNSLGEQISRYCQATPGASLDGRNPHELSVILSGPSDTNDGKQLNSVNTTKFAELMEDDGINRLYGRLDQDSVKSAEALHLMERNNEIPTTSLSDKKKKKRKTKQQRDSGILGRPKPYVISSSSADEIEAIKIGEDSCVTSLDRQQRRSPQSTTDDSNSDVNMVVMRSLPGQSKTGSEVTVLPFPTKTNKEPITVAECDSSTGLGMLDSESGKSSRLKEIDDSFMKRFGRKPRYSKEKLSDAKVNVNNDEVVLLSDSDQCVVGATTFNIINLCGDDNNDDHRDGDNSDGEEVGSQLHRAQGTKDAFDGPVCYMHSQDGMIYIGILHFGFKVVAAHNFHLNHQLYPVPRMSCMAITCLDEESKVRVFTGYGDSVCMMDMKTGSKQEVDVGTTVQCLHIMNHTLFVGLDTGEICTREIKSWKESNRYICSDCPIQCMASGKEGFTRLLCVASQDGTIIVVDADRCLPLRILVGHTQTAFSLFVENQYVYSGSRDSQVVIHNLHTARVEKVFKDNTGTVDSVCYSQGHLFTGGRDRLVRCYNVKNHKLVQVYYGADMGMIKYIHIHRNQHLLTGNSMGSVDMVPLDLKAKNLCKHKRCGLNFGLPVHLAWHSKHEHSSKK